MAGKRRVGRPRKGRGVLGNLAGSVLNAGKTFIKDNGANIAGNLAKVGAQALINKTLGGRYRVKKVTVSKRR